MGAESIMDLSNYGKTNQFRRELIDYSPAMIGTVPMYDAIGYLEKELKDITVDDFMRVVEHHAKQGVDFMTIHAGINRRAIDSFKSSERITNIVSRGGSLLFAWMEMTGNENPFYEHYDRLLDILHEYDVTISLGDALRPGSTHDSTDAPFYVLGPLVTDIAPGYDHITAAIGGAVAAAAGVDFLCYVTPAEHLRLPELEDVKEGIIATKIAAHAGDIAKDLPGARDIDNRMSDARRRIDWEEMFSLAIDSEKARGYFNSRPPEQKDSCSMCGKMCAMRTTNRILNGEQILLADE